MTTYYSVGSNTWPSTSIWSLTHGGAGGAGYPHSGDRAFIEGGFTVTVISNSYVKEVEIDGGTLRLEGNLWMDEGTDSNWFSVCAGSGTAITTSGTYSSPRTIGSTAGDPRYPWKPLIYDTTIARNLELENIIFEGAAWFLGNESCYLYFNHTDTAYPGKITNVVPPFRTPRLEYHQIDGRDTPRIYNNGGDAGVITIEGYFPWSSRYDNALKMMADRQESIAFTSRCVHMPRGHIESIRYRPKGLYVYFSAVLVEDPL